MNLAAHDVDEEQPLARPIPHRTFAEFRAHVKDEIDIHRLYSSTESDQTRGVISGYQRRTARPSIRGKLRRSRVATS